MQDYDLRVILVQAAHPVDKLYVGRVMQHWTKGSEAWSQGCYRLLDTFLRAAKLKYKSEPRQKYSWAQVRDAIYARCKRGEFPGSEIR